MASIQGIYIALFGRPADPLGLNYFNTVTNNGANLTAIGDLAATAEYQDRFAGMNNTQIVTAIYQSLFGRNPDLAGLTYFVNELNSGRQNINTIAINILDGAQNADKALVEAKVAAANQFTAAVAADPDALAAYQGETGIQFGQAFLAQIDEPTDTLTNAQVQAQVEAFGDGDPSIPGLPGTPGNILTLSANADVVSVDAASLQFRSTANGDNIRAIDAGSLGSADVIDGAGGFDVLNIDDAAIAGADATPVIRNVERINNSDIGATLNLASTTGLQQLWSNTAGAFTYTNASLSTVFGASGSAGAQTINIDFAGSLAGRTTAQLATTNVAGADAEFLFGGDATGIEAVSIDAASGAGEVTLDAALTVLDTITVTGAGRVTVDSLETTITTFDASANTGGVTFVSGALAAASTITGGSGNDTLDVSAAGNFVATINSGAGNDIVTGGAGRDVINLGEGNDIVTGGANGDTLTGGAGNDVFAYSSAAESNATSATSFDMITDFNNGNDTIDLSGFATDFTGLTSPAEQIAVENAVAALAPGATLLDAVNAAVAEITDGEVAWFQFGGNTYVVGDVAAVGDELVIGLTGNVALSASDFVFS